MVDDCLEVTVNNLNRAAKWTQSFEFMNARELRADWNHLVLWTVRLPDGHPALLVRLGDVMSRCTRKKAIEFTRALISQVWKFIKRNQDEHTLALFLAITFRFLLFFLLCVRGVLVTKNGQALFCLDQINLGVSKLLKDDGIDQLVVVVDCKNAKTIQVTQFLGLLRKIPATLNQVRIWNVGLLFWFGLGWLVRSLCPLSPKLCFAIDFFPHIALPRPLKINPLCESACCAEMGHPSY